VNGNVKQACEAARSGEWAQHFSNASCYISVKKYWKNVSMQMTVRVLVTLLDEIQVNRTTDHFHCH